MIRPSLAAVACVMLGAACGGADSENSDAATHPNDSSEVVEIPEAFFTPWDSADNVDSPAVWHGPSGEHWLLATAKGSHVILVSDAATGATLRRVGGDGTESGRLRRPNGIAIVDDLALVVERDNARVQVFSLPAFNSLATFGAEQLRRPYGIAVSPRDTERYAVFVTDNYQWAGEQIPPDSALGRRVHEFAITITADAVRSEHVRAFGDTSGPGVFRVVESIALDPMHGRLLIAEEHEGASQIKVYTTTGTFSGRVVDDGLFPQEAEGIALYACGDGGGYWVATDQGEVSNTFHVFDRQSLAHLGSFRGASVRHTDGIAVTPSAFGSFPAGAFYAVHDDGGVAALSWETIGLALGLDPCDS